MKMNATREVYAFSMLPDGMRAIRAAPLLLFVVVIAIVAIAADHGRRGSDHLVWRAILRVEVSAGTGLRGSRGGLPSPGLFAGHRDHAAGLMS